MAYQIYLTLNGEVLPKPDSYDFSLTDILSDSSGQTEAGTTQRDITRTGVVSISVSFSLSAEWLKNLSIYAKLGKITVQYFDTEEISLKSTEMFMTNYKVKLAHDTSYGSLWYVSFDLQEY